MIVTVYKHNRLDQIEKRDPDELAREFVATIRGERGEDYSRMGRPHIELEYRWFLTGQPLCLSWHEEESWAAIWAALDHLLAGDAQADEDVFAWLTEVVR